MSSVFDKSIETLRGGFEKLARSTARFRQRVRAGFDLGLPGAIEAETEPAPQVVVDRITHAPDGRCLYAIGDIHGRFDLLERLIALIEEDSAKLPSGVTPQLIFLGDYIDRGLQSRKVLDLLSGPTLSKFDPVFLLGNHEEALLNFLKDPGFGAQWVNYGGAETLYSYGFAPPNQRASLGTPDEMMAVRTAWTKLWEKFRAQFPEPHERFLRSLLPHYTAGDYIFVHAGLRPGVDLAQQTLRDLLWIRDEFLHHPIAFDKLVVHGHTPERQVFRDNRRIGLDTGAFLTGRLTAAKLIGTEIAFLTT